MRIPATVAVAVLAGICSVNCCAQSTASPAPRHRILTAYPRAVARTARNMVTFRDRFAAIEQWAQVGMILFDARTTQDALARCSGCYEANPLFSRHPGALRLYGEGTFLAFQEMVFTQYTHEEIDGISSPAWNLVPVGVSAMWHVEHGILNMQVQPGTPAPHTP